MTKKEWNSLVIGSKVETDMPYIINGKSYITNLHGEVLRFNSNHSQVLVKWNDIDGFENWYGRLGIELAK